MLLDRGMNFDSCVDHARCCLQPQNSICKMLNKLNFKFFEQIYYVLNNFLWECGGKLVLEGNFYSMARSTKKPLGWPMSDAVFKFKNFNFSF